MFCLFMPEKAAELGVRLDSVGQARTREILKRYAHWTRWTGRIVGGIFIIAGLVIFFASRT
jgi:threonine/homoserine/homoserine lactone efflux protein